MKNAKKGFWEICEYSPTYTPYVQTFLSFFCHQKKTVLCAKAFTESTLPFWEYMIEIFIHLIVETPFIYLRQIRQDGYWTIVFNIVPVFVFKKWNHTVFFNSEGKVASNIELLKLWTINSEEMSMLSLINFTGI